MGKKKRLLKRSWRLPRDKGRNEKPRAKKALGHTFSYLSKAIVKEGIDAPSISLMFFPSPIVCKILLMRTWLSIVIIMADLYKCTYPSMLRPYCILLLVRGQLFDVERTRAFNLVDVGQLLTESE
eukprot:Gb_41134 [translate_table: standard]